MELLKKTVKAAARPFFATFFKKSDSDSDSKRLADTIKAQSKLLQKGPPDIYKIPLKEEKISVKGCRRFSFGKKTDKHSRTIMVLGATGAGKSTLINGMINYILGVKWEDSYRFKLVDEDQSTSQAHSQTSEVTVYQINHQDGFTVPFSLTIIDTPGFGDTRGIDRDREITDQLRSLFSDPQGVSVIDAVCFVAQASLARLTPTQKYVFDSVLSIFGKDVAENIRVLVTFADGQRPPVLEAITASGVPCPKREDGLPEHFKFNNSALFAHNKPSEAHNTGEDDEGFDKMFWNMGISSMKKFFAALNEIETRSLILTKEVLRERRQLEVSVENLQIQVKVGLSKLEEIKETREKIKDNEAEISRNEKFEFEVTVKKPIQVDISGTGIFLTNCQQCHMTCHDNCVYANDEDKVNCCAMGSDGYCTQCPGKCYWREHFNQKYKWEYKDVTEKKTVKDLKAKYMKAKGEKLTVQGLMDRLQAEMDDVQAEVVKLIQKSSNILNRLKEISLKPNPLTTPEYIDMLIEGEKSEAKPGWKQRVSSLISMREKAELMAKVQEGKPVFHHQEAVDPASHPESTQSKKSEPESTQSEESKPESTQSKESEPEPESSQFKEPESEPESTQSEESEPESTQSKEPVPESTQSKEPEPESTQSKEPEPEPTQPKESEPESTQSKESEPECTQSKEPEPESTQSEESEPDSSQSKEPEPESTQSEESEPEPESSQSKEPEPESTQSEESELESSQSKEPEPESTQPKDPEPESTQSKEPEPESTQSKESEPEPESSQSEESEPESESSQSKESEPEPESSQSKEPESEPESTQSKESEPVSTQSEESEPESTQSKESESEPESTQSKEPEPESTQSKESEPESTQSKESEPESTQSKEPESEPESTQSKEPEPESTQSKESEPESTLIFSIVQTCLCLLLLLACIFAFNLLF